MEKIIQQQVNCIYCEDTGFKPHYDDESPKPCFCVEKISDQFNDDEYYENNPH